MAFVSSLLCLTNRSNFTKCLLLKSPKALCLPTATLKGDQLNPEVFLKERKERGGAAVPRSPPMLICGWNTDDCLHCYFSALTEPSAMIEMF